MALSHQNVVVDILNLADANVRLIAVGHIFRNFFAHDGYQDSELGEESSCCLNGVTEEVTAE